MSVKSKSHQSLLTAQISNLLDRMFKRSPIKDSILDGASDFYANQSQVDEINEGFDNREQRAPVKKKNIDVETDRNNFKQQLKSERVERNERMLNTCYEILELTEGDTFEETNRKSAQVLGTIQLLSYTEGSQVAKVNEMHKPLYKAILCLRLLDRLIITDTVNDSYVQHFLGDIRPEEYIKFKELDPEGYKVFTDEVKVAVIIAALVQDIGNYHPDAQTILVGPNEDKDPYRTLELEDRKNLLQINYRETIKFLIDGLGPGNYLGNSKKDRDLFTQQETRKLKFIKGLLKNAINPKDGIGNMLKVPQIYVSIVMSTKPNYNYKLIPKVYQALNQNAERGNCSQLVVDHLYKITGMFPQGFGVTYLALDAAGNSLERYEYAIVNHLYPANPEEPHCRMATRQMSFVGYGTDMVVHKTENLYFAESAKRLASMSKERLLEILEKLVSNYQERSELDLIPRCWHPRDFFTLKEHQKLWNKA